MKVPLNVLSSYYYMNRMHTFSLFIYRNYHRMNHVEMTRLTIGYLRKSDIVEILPTYNQ